MYIGEEPIEHKYPEKDVECKNDNILMGKIGCGWKGKCKELRNELYKSPQETWNGLCGKEGTVYKCPKCGKELDHLWTCIN